MVRWWVPVHCAPPIRELDSGVSLCRKRDLSFLHCRAFFPFDQFFRVFDGFIVMVLATKGICRRCFIVFKILVVLSGVAIRVSEPWKSLPLL